MKISIATKDYLKVSGQAGQARPMKKRGADELLTGDLDPAAALVCPLAGDALPDTRFDITPPLCKLRDLFSRH